MSSLHDALLLDARVKFFHNKYVVILIVSGWTDRLPKSILFLSMTITEA